MAITIDSAFISEYDALVRHIAQQSESLIRPHVTEVASGGENYNFERLGATDAAAKTTRRAVTPWIDDVWTRRVAVAKTFSHALSIEQEDRVQMLVDPQSAYAENQGMAMRRAIDGELVRAVEGTGDLDGAGGAVGAPNTIGDGTAEISFDLVTQVQEYFMANTINPDIPKTFVVGPAQVRKLMQLTEQTSSDYVNREALQRLNATGICPNWMGFTWVVSTLLNVPSAGQTDCFALTKRAVGLAVNQNTFTRITENPERSYMTQVYSQWTMGAARVEDEHVTVLHVAD